MAGGGGGSGTERPYHAGPGTRHEIGVMVGFIVIFILSIVLYLIVWKLSNKREAAKEQERRHLLQEKTVNFENTGEKEVLEMDRNEERDSVAHGY